MFSLVQSIQNLLFKNDDWTIRLLAREGQQPHVKEGDRQQDEEEEADWQDATPIPKRVVRRRGELPCKGLDKVTQYRKQIVPSA